MLVIPVQPLPNQTLQVQLNGQPVQLNLYQTNFQMQMDVLLAGEPIIQGQPCQNLNLLVRYSYLGFEGDLTWLDTEGTDDPDYLGLGSRFQLLYLDPTDVASLNLPTGQT
jgi:hypothetical protein